jgi:hypothetical protein
MELGFGGNLGAWLGKFFEFMRFVKMNTIISEFAQQIISFIEIYLFFKKTIFTTNNLN